MSGSCGKKYDPSDFESLQMSVRGVRAGCFAVFGVDDPVLGTQRIVFVSELRPEAYEDRQAVLENLVEQTVRQLGVTLDEVLLVPAGSMSKTSSGKRRHRHYRELYLQGRLDPVASFRRS